MNLHAGCKVMIYSPAPYGNASMHVCKLSLLQPQRWVMVPPPSTQELGPLLPSELSSPHTSLSAAHQGNGHLSPVSSPDSEGMLGPKQGTTKHPPSIQEGFLVGSSHIATAELGLCCQNSAHSNDENEKRYLQNTFLLPTSIPRLFLSGRFDFFLQSPSANKTSRDGSWDKTRLQAPQKLNTFITLLLRALSEACARRCSQTGIKGLRT